MLEPNRYNKKFASYDRIRKRSTDKAIQKIDEKTIDHMQLAIAGGPIAIHERLEELKREWDIDRVLMFNFALLVFPQLLAARKNKKWLWGPLIQTPLLFMHATWGWCPPSLWFRPLGFRTRFEIQAEREELLNHFKDEKYH